MCDKWYISWHKKYYLMWHSCEQNLICVLVILDTAKCFPFIKIDYEHKRVVESPSISAYSRITGNGCILCIYLELYLSKQITRKQAANQEWRVMFSTTVWRRFLKIQIRTWIFRMLHCLFHSYQFQTFKSDCSLLILAMCCTQILLPLSKKKTRISWILAYLKIGSTKCTKEWP